MITLLTDFGYNSIQIARAKAWLMQHCPNQPIVDLAHDIHPNDINEAAYVFRLVVGDFAPNTIHIIAIDFDQRHNHSELVYFKLNDQHVITYNSGIASLLLGQDLSAVYVCDSFTGRHYDSCIAAFGPIAQRIITGKISDQLTSIDDKANIKTPFNPVKSEKLLQGHVLYIDTREKCYTNISRQLFEEFVQNDSYDIILSRHEKISKITHDLKTLEGGGTYCYFNEAGLLTIAVYRGSAKRMYGLKRGQSLMIEKR